MQINSYNETYMKKHFSFFHSSLKRRFYEKYSDLTIWTFLKEYEKTLDIGTGMGRNIIGKQNIIGIDVSEYALHKLNELNELNDMCRMSADALGFSNSVFDNVIFSHVIEHLETPQISLNEINRILKPNGKLICIIPKDYAIEEKYRDPTHIHTFTPEQVINHLMSANFNIVKIKENNFYYLSGFSLLPFKLAYFIGNLMGLYFKNSNPFEIIFYCVKMDDCNDSP